MEGRQFTARNLPQEVLLALFTNMDLPDFGPAALVCRRWFQMSKDNELWRQKCVETWSNLPQEKDCKRNWIIPTKEGSARIDWQQLYLIRKFWPSVMLAMKQLHATCDQENISYNKKEKDTLAKFIDDISKKNWITATDFRQLHSFARDFFNSHAYAESDNNTNMTEIELFEDTIKFFLKMDSAMLAKSTSATAKYIGLGIEWSREALYISWRLSGSLFWSMLGYARHYIDMATKKGFLRVESTMILLFQITNASSLLSMRNELPRPMEIVFKLWRLIIDAIGAHDTIKLVFGNDDLAATLNRRLSVMKSITVQYRTSFFDSFLDAVKGYIYPPKTVRDSLTLVCLKNHLQAFANQKEAEKFNPWAESLPVPTGPANDKILVLYHLEVLNCITDPNPRDNVKVNASCDFILNAFDGLKDSWKIKALQTLLQHNTTKSLLLTTEQERSLFEKLHVLGQCGSKQLKSQRNVWLVKFALACDRLNEYLDLVLDTITDPANSELLGAQAFQNVKLVSFMMEEYAKQPRVVMEDIFLRFAFEILRKQNANQDDFFAVLISIIGRRIVFEEEGTINEGHQENFEDQRHDVENEDFSQGEKMDEKESEFEGESDSRSESGSESGGDFYEEGDEDRKMLRKLSELIGLAEYIEDAVILKNVPAILNIIKTKFDYDCVAYVLRNILDRVIGCSSPALVADEIAAVVTDWICSTTTLTNVSLWDIHQIIKNLLNVATKVFLKADVVSKLVARILENPGVEDELEMWVLLLTHAEDPAGVVDALHQYLESQIKSGDLAQEYHAVRLITQFICCGEFKHPRLVALLDLTLQVRHHEAWYNPEGEAESENGTILPREKAEFIGAAALHHPAFFVKNLNEILRFFEDNYQHFSVHAASTWSLDYAAVINLIEHPPMWVHHVTMLIENLVLTSLFLRKSSAVARLAFFDLLLPSHPWHKLLLEAGLKERIRAALTQINGPVVYSWQDELPTLLKLREYYNVQLT